MDLTFQVPVQYCSYSIRPCFYYQSHPQLGLVFVGSIPSFFLEFFSTNLQLHIGHLMTCGVPLSASYHFAFSYCSWGSWEPHEQYEKETVSGFIFWGSKITADGDCSHEIKRWLLLGKKVMTNLDSILKSRDITLPTEVHLVKAMAFPVVMYGCESWAMKKAEHQRIDAFELWC